MKPQIILRITMDRNLISATNKLFSLHSAKQCIDRKETGGVNS
jgi:hypothetical protein